MSSAQDASVLDSHGFSKGVFDSTVFYESVDKRVRRQAEDSEGSGDNQEILSTVNVF